MFEDGRVRNSLVILHFDWPIRIYALLIFYKHKELSDTPFQEVAYGHKIFMIDEDFTLHSSTANADLRRPISDNVYLRGGQPFAPKRIWHLLEQM